MSDPENPVQPTHPKKEDWVKGGSSNVVVLNDNNFKNAISSASSTLVMFYAPCKCF